MEYLEDNTLTKEQKALKWSLYCECELERDEDIIKASESLLRDLDTRRT